jgi:TolB protein
VYAELRIRGETGQNRLAIMNADGSGRRALTAFGGVDEINPKWMPDGQTIVFEQLRQTGRRSDIAAIGPDGGPVRRILSTPAWETNPIPSPDGTRILFTSDRDRRGPERLGPGTELYTMAVDGSDVVRLTDNRRPDIFPDWQRLP